MRAGNQNIVAEYKPLGVIDALTGGFDLVRRRPWTMAIPVVLDLVLWIAPRLSLAPIFRPFVDLMAVPGSALAGDSGQSLADLRDSLQQAVNSINLLGMVQGALRVLVSLPSLLGSQFDLPQSPITGLAYSIPVASAGLMLMLFGVLLLLGLFAAALFLESLASGVRPLGGTNTPALRFQRVALLWFRLILYSVLLWGILLLATPVLVLVMQATTFSPDVGSFLLALVLVGVFWIAIYLHFTVEAMTVSGVGVGESVRRSILMFRLSFWQSMGLILLSLLLEQGLGIFWQGLQVSSIGVLIGIAGNAFIGTSLIAAAMLFYQDRFNFLQRVRDRLRAKA